MSLFVTLEGPDGSGKSTQINLLRRAPELASERIVCTREPGGTPIGEQIRTLLHDLRNAAMLPMTEILLFSAARAQLVGEVIRPALDSGAIVISDRFAESTVAYQGYGRGLDRDTLRAVTRLATDGLAPDLVIYLDLDVAVGLGRKRRDQSEGKGEWNRMDDLDLAFHRRVREGYQAMAREEPGRWLVIDATQPVQAIHRRILDEILARHAATRPA
ncbi:MAG: dTMP kinase [Anaerolineae bacterium]